MFGSYLPTLKQANTMLQEGHGPGFVDRVCQGGGENPRVTCRFHLVCLLDILGWGPIELAIKPQPWFRGFDEGHD